jgi:thiamine kinase-like enzyme
MLIKRKIGEATTQYERDVEAAVARIESWNGRSISYSMMVGGISNQNWRIEVQGDSRTYFLKSPGAGTETYIDRNVANEAARNAYQLGLGPEVVFFDAATGVEVSEFLDGYTTCTTSDFQDPDIQSQVIDIYRKIHGGPRLSHTKTAFDMIDESLDQARMLNADLPEDIGWLEHCYGQAKAAFFASGLDLVSCYNDPMPGNFLIRDGAPMRLVDCEYASVNERAFELGLLSAEMFYDEAVTSRLVELYYGRFDAGVFARVCISRALADLRWGFWAAANRKNSKWDFDYQKYSAWKFIRARETLFDPRWPAWLRAV